MIAQSESTTCNPDFLQSCSACAATGGGSNNYTCDVPGLEDFTPGKYEGTSGKKWAGFM